MLFIIAGDFKQARACGDWLELHPRNWTFVANGDELRATDGAKVLQFGTFWKHERYNEIMEICRHQRAYVSSLNDRR